MGIERGCAMGGGELGGVDLALSRAVAVAVEDLHPELRGRRVCPGKVFKVKVVVVTDLGTG